MDAVISVCTLCAVGSVQHMEDFGTAKRDWFETFLCLRQRHSLARHLQPRLRALDPKEFLDCFLPDPERASGHAAGDRALTARPAQGAGQGSERPYMSALGEGNRAI